MADTENVYIFDNAQTVFLVEYRGNVIRVIRELVGKVVQCQLAVGEVVVNEALDSLRCAYSLFKREVLRHSLKNFREGVINNPLRSCKGKRAGNAYKRLPQSAKLVKARIKLCHPGNSHLSGKNSRLGAVIVYADISQSARALNAVSRCRRNGDNVTSPYGHLLRRRIDHTLALGYKMKPVAWRAVRRLVAGAVAFIQNISHTERIHTVAVGNRGDACITVHNTPSFGVIFLGKILFFPLINHYSLN